MLSTSHHPKNGSQLSIRHFPITENSQSLKWTEHEHVCKRDVRIMCAVIVVVVVYVSYMSVWMEGWMDRCTCMCVCVLSFYIRFRSSPRNYSQHLDCDISNHLLSFLFKKRGPGTLWETLKWPREMCVAALLKKLLTKCTLCIRIYTCGGHRKPPANSCYKRKNKITNMN